jgi:hypothetical protein
MFNFMKMSDLDPPRSDAGPTLRGKNGITVLPGKDSDHVILSMFINDQGQAWVEFDDEQLQALIALLERERDRITKR